VSLLLLLLLLLLPGKSLVDQKLTKRNTNCLEVQCTLLWPVFINKTVVQQNRIKTLHHSGNPLE